MSYNAKEIKKLTFLPKATKPGCVCAFSPQTVQLFTLQQTRNPQGVTPHSTTLQQTRYPEGVTPQSH